MRNFSNKSITNFYFAKAKVYILKYATPLTNCIHEIIVEFYWVFVLSQCLALETRMMPLMGF